LDISTIRTQSNVPPGTHLALPRFIFICSLPTCRSQRPATLFAVSISVWGWAREPSTVRPMYIGLAHDPGTLPSPLHKGVGPAHCVHLPSPFFTSPPQSFHSFTNNLLTKMRFSLTFAAGLLALGQGVAARDVPTNVRNFYHRAVANEKCPRMLQGGFHSSYDDSKGKPLIFSSMCL